MNLTLLVFCNPEPSGGPSSGSPWGGVVSLGQPRETTLKQCFLLPFLPPSTLQETIRMCSTKVGRKPRNGRLGTESLAPGGRIGGLWGGSPASLQQELRTQVVTGHEHRATDHLLPCLEHEDRTSTMCLAHFSVLFCPFPGAVSASLSKHLAF